jgi:hypothetical protein
MAIFNSFLLVYQAGYIEISTFPKERWNVVDLFPIRYLQVFQGRRKWDENGVARTQ